MSETLRELRYELTAQQAVALFDLVARSSYTNGLGGLYAALGEMVRDANGHVPEALNYEGPSWEYVAR